MPKNYFFPDLCSISKEPKPNVCHFSGIFRKKSTKMLAIKSGEKQNLEIYCVFLVTLNRINKNNEIFVAKNQHNTMGKLKECYTK